jgi:hypothetical protein
VRDVNENLGSQLASATQMADHLKRQLSECDSVVRRLGKIAIAARPQHAAEAEQAPAPAPTPARLPPPKSSNAKAVAAAAQAFSERRRSGGLAA